MRAARTSIALFGALAIGGAARAQEATPGPYRIIGSGTAAIALDEAVGDVVAVDAKLEIAGLVRGHLYAVDAEITVRSTAIILKSITLQGGRLRVDDGAVLPPDITLAGAALERPDGTAVSESSGRIELAEGALATLTPVKPATVALALMKSVLPFDRFAPDAAVSAGSLSGWHPGLGLELKKSHEDPEEVVVAGIARLTFVSGKVTGAFQRGYRGARGTVLLTGVKLADEAAAIALWKVIESAVPPSKVALSVRTALGGGAHWYFERKQRHNMLWRKGAWFFAVETQLEADGATVYQQRQFSDQVLRELRNGLARTAASARRDTSHPIEGVTR